MYPSLTESRTPLAIAPWTVPIRILVYLSSLTVTLLTIKVAGLTITSVFIIANTFVWPLIWFPIRVAKAVPNGPFKWPITTSGSAAVPGGPPAIRDSPTFIIKSLFIKSPLVNVKMNGIVT